MTPYRSWDRQGVVLAAESCLTLCDPVDCSPPGSSVHGILQAGILEWVAILFSRGSSRPRDQTCVSRIVGRFFAIWASGVHLFKLHPNIMIPWFLLCMVIKCLSVKWTSFIFWYLPAAGLLGWDGECPHQERCAGAEKRDAMDWRWSGGTVQGAVCAFRAFLQIPRSQYISEGF